MESLLSFFPHALGPRSKMRNLFICKQCILRFMESLLVSSPVGNTNRSQRVAQAFVPTGSGDSRGASSWSIGSESLRCIQVNWDPRKRIFLNSIHQDQHGGLFR